jgi:UDP-glucose 4-epimerase
MNKQTYVITGGAGFIGTNMAVRLVEQGHDVSVIDDLSAGIAERLPAAVQFHKLDVRDTKKLSECFEGADVVVHLAAQPRVQDTIDHPISAHDVNVNGTLSVLEAVRSASVGKLVFASTAAVYGDQEALPLTLDLSARPKSPYGLHKYIGEQYVKLWSELYNLKTVSLRFFNVYGPHFDPDGPYALVVGRFLKLKSEGKPLTIVGDGEQTRDFVHVDDVVAAVIQAAESETAVNGEVYNIGSGVETTVNEIAALVGGDTESVPPRYEPNRVVADISKAVAELDWRPARSLAEGIGVMKKELGIE